MRVGSVTHRVRPAGARALRRAVGLVRPGDLVVTNVVTLVAEFVAIRVGLAYFGLGGWVAASRGRPGLFTVSGGRYWRWERVVLGIAVFNGLFLVAAVHGRPRWARSGMRSPPHGAAGRGHQDALLLVASTIGATVTRG